MRQEKLRVGFVRERDQVKSGIWKNLVCVQTHTLKYRVFLVNLVAILLFYNVKLDLHGDGELSWVV